MHLLTLCFVLVFIAYSEAFEEPPNLWVSTPEDSFPNPDEDLVGFVEYCGHTLQEVSVTRKMVESGEELKPIAVELPFIFSESIFTVIIRQWLFCI